MLTRHTHGIIITSVNYFHCYFIWVCAHTFLVWFILRNFIYLIRILCLFRPAYAREHAHTIWSNFCLLRWSLCVRVLSLDSICQSRTVTMHAVLVPISINIWSVGLIYKQSGFLADEATAKRRRLLISAKFLLQINHDYHDREMWWHLFVCNSSQRHESYECKNHCMHETHATSTKTSRDILHLSVVFCFCLVVVYQRFNHKWISCKHKHILCTVGFIRNALDKIRRRDFA